MTNPIPISQRAKPIQRFATAAAKCKTEGSAYGKCIMADYNNVYQDKCLTEFMKLKDCFIVGLQILLDAETHAIDIQAEEFEEMKKLM